MPIANKNLMLTWIALIVDWVKENKLVTTSLFAVVAFIGVLLQPIKEKIFQKFWPQTVEINISFDKRQVCDDCEVKMNVRLVQKSPNKISAGTIDVELGDHLHFEDQKQSAITVSEFEGIVEPFSKYLIIRTERGHVGRVWLQLHYSNQSFKTSKRIEFEVSRRNSGEKPFVVTTDTNRINLSGNWSISVGADDGEMTITQSPNAKIQGTYELGGARSESGIVSGFKDGASLRVFFYKNEQDKNKQRIEGIFRINSDDDHHIEIKGCTYGIQRDNSISMDSETEETCTKLKNYYGWRGVSVTKFYASSQLR